MSRSISYKTGKYVLVLAAGLSLLHGLVAGPLVVHCIPADGQAVLELLGHDPHQHMPAEQSAATIKDFYRAGHCTDLLLVNPAILRHIASRIALGFDHWAPGGLTPQPPDLFHPKGFETTRTVDPKTAPDPPRNGSLRI